MTSPLCATAWRVVVAAVLTFVIALPTPAQDLFGRAVAVSGHDVIVLKSGTSRGAAAVIGFRQDDSGAWQESFRLTPIDAAPGEMFGGSLAIAGNTLVVAAADPDARWGAHVYRRSGSAWQPVSRVPLEADAGAAPATALNLQRIIAITAPPLREVAISSDGQFIAIALTGYESGEIVIVRADGDAWTEEARIQTGIEAVNGVGIEAIALSQDRLFVGAPQPQEGGAEQVVLVYARDASGSWQREAVLRPPAELTAESSFGTPLATDGSSVLVGARRAVAVFRRSDDGTWANTQLLRPDAGIEGSFGNALAVHRNTLWISGPGRDPESRVVHQFRRNDPSAQWVSDGVVRNDDIESSAFLGHAVGLGDAIGVAGAPYAGDGQGVASVWTRSADGGWSDANTLDSGAALTVVTGGEIRCADGHAGRFDCRGVDLLAFLPIESIGGEPGEHVSDLWGWTDPQTKREYALVGRNRGVAIVDVTSPASPRYLGVLPGNRAGPRDIKIFRDHLFFVGDGADAHGMIVFDLSRLRNVQETPTVFTPDAHYHGVASAHNLVMDVESGTAIPVGASGGGNTCGGGLHMVDVREPKNPTFVGCYTDSEGLIAPGRTHDAQCVVYRGPDSRYQNRQICFVSNETALRIVDITDKSTPTPVSRASYPSRAYIHQGWLTDDQRYFFMNDEIDELVGLTDRTRTLIWDVADLEDPVLAGEFLGPDASTDHNLYIRGNFMYLANYQAGLRVVDISDPVNPAEVGFFDTTPYAGNPPGWFGGAWTAFPFLESGTVLVSSINEGLFVLRPVRPVS